MNSSSELGALMGVTTAPGSLMSILGPLWTGAVYGHGMGGSPYWIGAVIYLVAALVLARMKKTSSQFKLVGFPSAGV